MLTTTVCCILVFSWRIFDLSHVVSMARISQNTGSSCTPTPMKPAVFSSVTCVEANET